MQADQLKQRIQQIEQCADDAKRAVQAGSAPPELRQSVDSLHQQVKQAQQSVASQPQMGDTGVRNTVLQLEQAGDRAVQACRKAANVDQQTQQAVQRAHDEISNLKKQIQMG